MAAFFLPEQRSQIQHGTAVEIILVSPGEAVIEFIRHAFVAHIVETTGLPEQRLRFFARLVRQIPMYKIIYPRGVEHLPNVRQAIISVLDSENDA